MTEAIDTLVQIMVRLRGPDGCDWDRAQTFSTIAPYTIEEAYEVADAIARSDIADLRDELGDLLLQVVFHSRIAEDSGLFSLDDVAASINAKMIRRHPHIFGDADAGDDRSWEALKAAERAKKGATGALDGIALGLPALQRAEKIQRRAAQVGFDWPDATGARAKVTEELCEVEEAVGDDAREDEIGDLLFAVVNWSRHLGIDAETALRRATRKFETRFAAMEVLTENLGDLPPHEQEALWQLAKAATRKPSSAD